MSITIETARLTIRPLTAEDLPLLKDLHRDPLVVQLLYNGVAPPESEAEERLRGFLQDWEDVGIGFFAVFRRSSEEPGGVFIGRMGFRLLPEADDLELGACFRGDASGEGFAPEAARAIVGHAIHDLGYPRVVGVIRPENTRAQSYVAKLGFRYRGDRWVFGRVMRYYEIDARDLAESAPSTSGAGAAPAAAPQDAGPSPVRHPNPQRQCDLIVHSGVLVTVDAHDAIYRDGALAIGGDRILRVGTTPEILSEYEARHLIDAKGGVVHPGFIDAHIHVSQYAARSVLPRMADGAVNMGDWKAALTAEDEYASAALAAVDYLRSGYTGFVDPGTIFEPDAVADAVQAVGMRLWLTDPYVADRAAVLASLEPDLASPSFLARWPTSLDDALSRLGSQLHRNRAPQGRVHAYLGLYGEGTASNALYDAAFAMAKSEGVQMQQHFGYSPKSYLAFEAELGRSVLADMAENGRLGPHVTFIHMNLIHAPDAAIIVDRGLRLVWCPYGQLQMIGKGQAEPRHPDLHRRGVPVGIGSDIPRAVLFQGLGGLASAAAAAGGVVLSPSDLMRMRTVGAAASVGSDAWVGSLEPGKRADVVIRSPEDVIALGVDDVHELAVLGGARVAHVLVGGERVLSDRQLVRADVADVCQQARTSTQRLLTRIGL